MINSQLHVFRLHGLGQKVLYFLETPPYQKLGGGGGTFLLTHFFLPRTKFL